MLSFLGAGEASSGEAASIRTVSGDSSHRMGLDAALSEPMRPGCVVTEGFSKVHCCSCEATATSAMSFISSVSWLFLGVKRNVGAVVVVGRDVGGLNGIITGCGARCYSV